MTAQPDPSLPSQLRPSGRVQLSCQWERFSVISAEIRPMMERQQAEVGKDYEPYDPDWDRYFAFDRAGSLRIWTARTIEGFLVGYVFWLLLRSLHASSTRFATADLIYLAPEWREGLLGYRFLRSAISAVSELKPDIIRVETNDLYEDGRLGLLLRRLKFRRIGSVYQT